LVWVSGAFSDGSVHRDATPSLPFTRCQHISSFARFTGLPSLSAC
jgi:hypothetical protein